MAGHGINKSSLGTSVGMCTNIVRVLYELREMRVACERSSRIEMCVSPEGTRRSYRSRSRDFLGTPARISVVYEVQKPTAYL